MFNMNFNDMTENVKVQSAAPLNDNELESVSGGKGSSSETSRLVKTVYYVYCTKCDFYYEGGKDSGAAEKYIEDHNGICYICDGDLKLGRKII